MLDRNNSRHLHSISSPKETATEKAQSIIMMEFYSSDDTIQQEDIGVVTLTDFGKDWVAYVEVHDDGCLYRVHYHRGTNVVDIEIYHYEKKTTLTIT